MYGWRGSANTSFTRPRSTISPAYMTPSSLHVWLTTPRSWVTKTSAVFGVLAQLLEQAEHLVLHRHVERGGRLVAQQQLRRAGQRHRDHDALAQSAGELVRVGPGPAGRVGDAGLAHHVDGEVHRGRLAEAEVPPRGLGDLVPDPHHRIQRGHRLLEDHRDLLAGQRRRDLAVMVCRSLPRYSIAPDSTLDPGGQQVGDRPQRHGLARAGLADDAEALALGDVEADVIDDDGRRPALALDAKRQVAHREQRSLVHLTSSGPG